MILHLRSAKAASADADANAAKTSEARAIALDQLAEANEESAKLRELNDRFVREQLAGDTMDAGDATEYADRSWVLGDDFPPDNAKHPTDVFVDFGRVVKAIEGDGDQNTPWVEIDMRGKDALPRVVTQRGVDDKSRRKWFMDYNAACPLVNRVSPMV